MMQSEENGQVVKKRTSLFWTKNLIVSLIPEEIMLLVYEKNIVHLVFLLISKSFSSSFSFSVIGRSISLHSSCSILESDNIGKKLSQNFRILYLYWQSSAYHSIDFVDCQTNICSLEACREQGGDQRLETCTFREILPSWSIKKYKAAKTMTQLLANKTKEFTSYILTHVWQLCQKCRTPTFVRLPSGRLKEPLMMHQPWSEGMRASPQIFGNQR